VPEAGESEAAPYSRLAGVYDEMVVDSCHGRWAAHLDELWRADSHGVRTVLDLCCGTGLMAKALIELGYHVTGVDGSSAMLARARHVLPPGTVLARQVLPELTVDGPFDAAVSTFDGLNYLTPAEFASTVSAVGRRLRPRGWLVFDVHADAMLEFARSHPVVEGEAAGMRFTIRNDVDVRARNCVTRIDVTGNTTADTFSEQHRQYFFSDADVRDALSAAGFGPALVTDEYTDQPASRSTLRSTWICRRGAP
jgi:SAM-dependent methyltransferase